MAILLNLPSTTYAVNTQKVAVNLSQSITQVEISLTHFDWPTGPCIEYEVFWSGVSAGKTTIGGGVVRDKAGNPTGLSTVTTINNGVPYGFSTCHVSVSVLQSLTTAILVESI